MGDFIIIALLVSSFWFLCELLRILSAEKMRKEELFLPAGELGKEQLLRCADSFEQLAGIFHGISGKKEELSDGDMQEILREAQERVCIHCDKAGECWLEKSTGSYHRFSRIVEGLEEEGDDMSAGRKEALQEHCCKGEAFFCAVRESFGKARLNLIWNNRILENRSASADQLYETAQIIRRAADHIYDVKKIEGSLRQQADVRLRMHGIVLKDIWCVKQDRGMQLYVTLRTSGKGRCVSVKEIAELLSVTFCCHLVQDMQGRSIINQEYSTVLLLSEPEYYMQNGVARVMRDGEVVSGDNFALFCRENGQMIMSLSDGMGTGLTACRESETVIELLEQFLGSGFDKETAIRLIHSSMLLQTDGNISTTVDLCMTDLYTGECEFLKMGASTTFVKRNGWVESVTSTSMPMGILQGADYECTKKKLEGGDYIVMVSDGVMDALPQQDAEEILKNYLLDTQIENARELAKSLLEYVLRFGEYRARDDMTVLVGGLWKQ